MLYLVSLLKQLSAVCCLALLLASPLYAASDEPSELAQMVVEYLYIDANEDQASGGHAAMRIDQDVFHFQFDGGLLALARDDWADFQLSYRGYQNRNIYASRLALTPDTGVLLRQAFVRRYLTQSAQLQRLADARSDYQLLLALRDPDATALLLPGFGFFASAQSIAQQASFESVRAALALRHDTQFLLRQRAELVAELAALKVRPVALTAEDFEPGVLPQPDYAFNRRYADLVAAIRAIDVLRGGWGLDPERLALASLANADFQLDERDYAVLAQAIAQLEQRLVRLVGSSTRPDWGGALLLGLARLETMHLSLQRGRWVFFDVLHLESDRLPVGNGLRESLPGLQEDARQVWLQAHEQWRSEAGWDEHSYTDLETRAVNVWELQRVIGGADEWRVRGKQGIPHGRGYLAEPPVPQRIVDRGADLERALDNTLVAAERYAEDNLGYRLLERNCVSELFATMAQGVARGVVAKGLPLDEETLQQETMIRLGEVFAPSPVPFYSSRQVRKNWRIENYQALPSLRKLYTAQRYREDPSLGVLLKESNTLTSSVYRRSDDDSFFIFFTDGNTAVRPVLGLVNLTSALGMSVVGVFQAPFDAGHGLSAGLRGALFSLPELGFQNIRKGTSTWLVPELRTVY